MAVPVRTSKDAIELGSPRRLGLSDAGLGAPAGGDGERFIMIKPVGGDAPNSVVVVPNWALTLR